MKQIVIAIVVLIWALLSFGGLGLAYSDISKEPHSIYMWSLFSGMMLISWCLISALFATLINDIIKLK